MYRPRYHFTAPKGWLNDPNGLIQHNGVYHLFYQHNPYSSVWANMHWGHATSHDLVYWQHHPIALAPSDDKSAYDAGGVFSGCCVIADDGTPTIIYTGVAAPNYTPQVPALAFGDANLQTWHKHPLNPVIPPPNHLNIVGFRDHTVWKENEQWHQLIGSGIRGQGGCVFHYTSANLLKWDYVGIALQSNDLPNAGHNSGTMWECPDFFSLPHPNQAPNMALCISPIPLNQVHYVLGEWRNNQLTPHAQGILDYGTAMWAPQSFTAEDGRRIMIGWLRESRPSHEQSADTWNGVMTLPRVLSLSADGKKIISQPATEVELLRGEVHQSAPQAIHDQQPVTLPVQSNCCEINLEIAPGDAGQIMVTVCHSPNKEERTSISYDHVHQSLWLDTTHSRQNSASGQANASPMLLAQGETLKLRIFIDVSVVEVYANQGTCLSGRIYPLREDSKNITIHCNRGSVFLQKCEIWSMKNTVGESPTNDDVSK